VPAQVDFVGVLFIVWGLLTALIGLSTLALGVGGVVLMRAAEPGSGQFAAGVTVAVFITLAVIAILWGAAHVAVGVPLRRRRPWARLMALTLGSLDLVLLPFGTALGVYALWVLLHQKGRALFEIADFRSQISD
jgi:hypothetical protein